MAIKVLKNEAAKRAEILIYDVIGPDFWGDGHSVAAKKFAADIKALGDVAEIVVRINSPGGDVWDALAIYNTLNQHPAKKIVEIEGLAASAASFIAMVGDEIRMAENGVMMIHLAQGMTWGDRNDHAKTIEMLAKHDEQIATTYAARANKEAAYFTDLMTAETWMSAEDAKGHGLVTAIIPAKRVEACAGPDCAKRFKNLPERARAFFNKGKGNRPMGKTNCECKKPKAKAKRVKNVMAYAALMNGAIETAASEERTREAILEELATAASMTVEDVEALLTDEGPCPTMEQIEAFAGVSGIPGASDQQAAAEEDGCEFGADEEDEEEAEEVANRLKQIEADAVAGRLDEIEKYSP